MTSALHDRCGVKKKTAAKIVAPNAFVSHGSNETKLSTFHEILIFVVIQRHMNAIGLVACFMTSLASLTVLSELWLVGKTGMSLIVAALNCVANALWTLYSYHTHDVYLFGPCVFNVCIYASYIAARRRPCRRSEAANHEDTTRLVTS